MSRISEVPSKVTRESDVESYFCCQVTELGGITRKLKWIGRNGAPDRFVSFFWTGPILVELKRPGKKAAPHQRREGRELTAHGVEVWLCATHAQVDEFINTIRNRRLH